MQKVENFVALSGTMGVGKTTATQLLAEKLGWEAYLEQPSNNPHIEDYYRDPKQFAFLSQRHYLQEKIKYTEEAGRIRRHKPVAIDAYIKQDVFSYALAQVELGYMTQAEWTEYMQIYNAAKLTLPEPNLLIFLQATVPTIMQRMHDRGRGYEAEVDASYVQLLDDLNYRWIKENRTVPVLMVPTDNIDIVHSPADQATFVETVQRSLPRNGTIFIS